MMSVKTDCPLLKPSNRGRSSSQFRELPGLPDSTTSHQFLIISLS